MSKDLFLMMREQEVATSNFLPTKKELQKSSEQFAKNIIDNGEHNIKEVYAQALRLKESLSTIEATLKKELGDENFEDFGLVGTFRSGGDAINYNEDDIVKNLEKQLKDRKELLKVALKSNDTIYDSHGVEVPKVSTTPRKSSLAISF